MKGKVGAVFLAVAFAVVVIACFMCMVPDMWESCTT